MVLLGRRGQTDSAAAPLWGQATGGSITAFVRGQLDNDTMARNSAKRLVWRLLSIEIVTRFQNYHLKGD